MGEPRRRVRGERVRRERGRRRDVVQGEAAAARRTLVDIEAVGGKEVLRRIWDGDARERIVLIGRKEHRLLREVRVQVHLVVKLLLAGNVLKVFRARARSELDAALALGEGVLDLDERVGAVGEEVGHLAREDAHDAEEQVARDAERHRHVWLHDILDRGRDVGLDDLELGDLLVHVRGEPDLAERALLREDELRRARVGWSQNR